MDDARILVLVVFISCQCEVFVVRFVQIRKLKVYYYVVFSKHVESLHGKQDHLSLILLTYNCNILKELNNFVPYVIVLVCPDSLLITSCKQYHETKYLNVFREEVQKAKENVLNVVLHNPWMH